MKPAKIEANFMVFAGGIRKESKNKTLTVLFWKRDTVVESLRSRLCGRVHKSLSAEQIVKNGHVLTLNHSDQTALSDLTEIENEWIKVTAHASHTIIIFYLFCKTRKEIIHAKLNCLDTSWP